MSLLEILCSSRSSCSSCVLRLRRFVVEVLRGFRGLNPWSFTNLWLFEVFGGFWAWFQWPLRSKKMIWMIPLRMFFVFEVEVLEVPEGFRAWFQQSFWTSELKISSRCLGLFSQDVLVSSRSPLKCFRKASIYRSLGVSEQHMAEFDWWHMSQPDWSAYVIAYTCWTVYVIAYMC